MRILFISGYLHPSQHHKVDLMADAPGVDILHILPPRYGKTEGMHPSANGQRAYTVRLLPLRTLGRAGDPHRIYHWPPRFHLREFKPDIIHCEHEQESLMAAEIALLRDLSAPHAPLILYSWQNILRRRSLAVRAVCAYTLRSAQHVVCASDEAGDVLRRQGFRGGTSTIPMFGVDTRVFRPRPNVELRARLGLSGFVAGYAGRLVPQKGIDVLLDAMALAGASIHALVIGDGENRAELESRAQQLGIAERCHFIPAVSQDAVADYINAMDALVLPSRTTPNWKEQFGRVLIEAMACKVVTLGSDSGAIPKVIGDAGLIFHEGDAPALGAHLRALADNPTLRRELAERGYRRVMANYTIERLAGRILEVWQSIPSRTGLQ